MDVGTGVTVTGTSVGVGVAAGVGVTSTTGFEEPHPVKVSIIVMPSTSIICFAFIIYHPLRSEDRSISFFIFHSLLIIPCMLLKVKSVFISQYSARCFVIYMTKSRDIQVKMPSP